MIENSRSAEPLLAIDMLSIVVSRQFVANWKIEFAIHRVGDRGLMNREFVSNVDAAEVLQFVVEWFESLQMHHGNPSWNSSQPVLGDPSFFDGF